MTREAERAVLGCLLSGFRDVDDLGITGPDFYAPWHEAVWNACRQVLATGARVDPIVVLDALGTTRAPSGVDRAVDLADMMGSIAVPADAPRYAAIVAESAAARRFDDAMIRVQQLREQGVPAADLADRARVLLDDIGQPATTGAVTAASLMPGVIDQIQHGRPKGLSLPWPDLDEHLRGIQPGHLVIIGARPAVGKSLMAQAIACHVARTRPALIESLEMSAEDLMNRVTADLASVDLSHLLRSSCDDREWQRIAAANERIAELQLHVGETARQTVAQIAATARKIARSGDLGVIVIDYLQLVGPADRRAPREQQVAQVSRDLKILAKELDVPVIALAQLNRKSAGGDKPTMAELRESGQIEADADVILLLHRDPPPDDWELSVIVEKNRHGPRGTVPLLVQGHYSRISSAWREAS